MTDIELVIKIPEEIYKTIQKTNRLICGRRNGKKIDYILFNAVDAGIPLPKGHGRLVDASVLRADSFCVDGEELLSINDLIIAPTIVEADKEE